MKAKRTVPTLLVCASLMALITSGCCWPYYRHGGHRRISLDLKVGSAPSAQTEIASR